MADQSGPNGLGAGRRGGDGLDAALRKATKADLMVYLRSLDLRGVVCADSLRRITQQRQLDEIEGKLDDRQRAFQRALEVGAFADAERHHVQVRLLHRRWCRVAGVPDES